MTSFNSWKNKLRAVFIVLCLIVTTNVHCCITDPQKTELIGLLKTIIESKQQDLSLDSDGALILYNKINVLEDQYDVYYLIMRSSPKDIDINVLNVIIKKIPSVAFEIYNSLMSVGASDIKTFEEIIPIAAHSGFRKAEDIRRRSQNIVGYQLPIYNACLTAARDFGYDDWGEKIYKEICDNGVRRDDVTHSIFMDILIRKYGVARAVKFFKEIYPRWQNSKNRHDLHGLGFGEAYIATHLLVRESIARRETEVNIIIGKGLHSKGNSAIRRAVFLFLLRHNDFLDWEYYEESSTKQEDTERVIINTGRIVIRIKSDYDPLITMQAQLVYERGKWLDRQLRPQPQAVVSDKKPNASSAPAAAAASPVSSSLTWAQVATRGDPQNPSPKPQ